MVWSVCFVECFDNFIQQDAQEFLNYLLNTIAETVQGMYVALISIITKLTIN